MLSAKTFFARLNELRTSWMSESDLIGAAIEFFKLNGYNEIELNKVFDRGDKVFNSLVVGSRFKENIKETISTYFKPRIDNYDHALFGILEIILFDTLDNYDNTNLMLVTDSLSYLTIIKSEEISTHIQNLMDEGMFLLFVNGRGSYALFDDFKKLSMPIPLLED